MQQNRSLHRPLPQLLPHLQPARNHRAGAGNPQSQPGKQGRGTGPRPGSGEGPRSPVKPGGERSRRRPGDGRRRRRGPRSRITPRRMRADRGDARGSRHRPPQSRCRPQARRRIQSPPREPAGPSPPTPHLCRLPGSDGQASEQCCGPEAGRGSVRAGPGRVCAGGMGCAALRCTSRSAGSSLSPSSSALFKQPPARAATPHGLTVSSSAQANGSRGWAPPPALG